MNTINTEVKDNFKNLSNLGTLESNSKTINIAIFGKGNVGGTLIDQIISNKKDIYKRRKIELNIFSIADSTKIVVQKEGFEKNWRDVLHKQGENDTSINKVIAFAKKHKLENLIAVDNTASKTFVENYISLTQGNFDLVSSNKIANTLSFNFYSKLRQALKEHKKTYLYETNVGAGLPLIDTIRLLHETGEDITKIRGVFSGSLSYLFNTFSSTNTSFSEILKKAIDLGYTEPDPREDLCGNDVARKLLILARELDLQNEIEDVVVENLIPKKLRSLPVSDFLKNLGELDGEYQQLKEKQQKNHVLRYIGELGGDLFKEKGELKVTLVSVSKETPLGALKESDAIFEIYTKSYGKNPIVIQGAGAGAEVTARGVLGDILRVAKNTTEI